MMAVDQCINHTGNVGEARVLVQADAMRRTIARWSLLVFDRAGHLRVNVLDERSTARNVQHLHAKTDREYWYVFAFGGGDDQQIRFVFDGLHRAELRMGLLAVAQRIDVRVTAGKQDAIELRDHSVDVVSLRNQTDMNRNTA